jgi:hypothetical protein
MPYVQEYIAKIGVRKCEANAIIPKPKAAYDLCIATIEKYLGSDAKDRFQKKRDDASDEYAKLMEAAGVPFSKIDDAITNLSHM